MSKPGLISFRRTDILANHIEQSTKDIADHFKSRRLYVPQFCRLIKVSKRWTTENLETELNKWESMFSRINGTSKIIKMVKESFGKCESNQEITDLRGAMVEALVIACNGGSKILSNRSYGWGAKVDIHPLGEEIIRVRLFCSENICDDCKDRKTVDFGFWDGYHGKFYECKVQPVGIGCKEIKYMQKLKEKLNQQQISHEIFFVCAESRDEVKIKLESLELSTVFYKPVGVEDIQDMMSA
ncbi:hypothetical protein FZC84_11820 [Rossellomorea vietnamensis]|uniref:Uncharacterized protein n=1 Tax=Rossellomorea vietnamensis TaxID=218284 RepID=A0A5D4MC84_9BACI|nr:hypothetical protein [Rossellomorea vietnamensis]TYR99057.1 hypothetical protein FZC84_11820 [Rossellomorea vietnamensis]